jgi:hypothetical protein
MLCFQKGGEKLLKYYGGSYIRALQSLYPELKLERERFLKRLGVIILLVEHFWANKTDLFV